MTFAIAGFAISEPLHFWVDDVLMTVFFLVVGMGFAARSIGDSPLLTAAKLGVLVASIVAGTTGLIIGKLSLKRPDAEPAVGSPSLPQAQHR